MAEDIGLEPAFDDADASPKPKKTNTGRSKIANGSGDVADLRAQSTARKRKKRNASDNDVKENYQKAEYSTDNSPSIKSDAPKSKKRKGAIKSDGSLVKKKKKSIANNGGPPSEPTESDDHLLKTNDVNSIKTSEEKEKRKEKKKTYKKRKTIGTLDLKHSKLLEEILEKSLDITQSQLLLKENMDSHGIPDNEKLILVKIFKKKYNAQIHRDLMMKLIAEDCSLAQLKEKVNELVKKKVLSRNDAGIVVSKWRNRETRRKSRQVGKQTVAACFNCRKMGHLMPDCPSKTDAQGDGICFKCGSTEHAIYKCPRKNVKGFPFATCFVCKEVGHLSRDCHQNSNGVFPEGGNCNVCGSKGHLKRDCPELAAQKAGTEKEKRFTAQVNTWAGSADADYDPTSEPSPVQEQRQTKKSKHIKF